MQSITKALLLSGAAVLMLGSVIDTAQARPRRYAQGHSVRTQQRAASKAPGFSTQTDAKQSATGGQAGGQPGQE